MKKVLLACLCLLSQPILAAEEKPAPVDPLSAETLWRVFGSLGAILLGIFALVWILRRSGGLTRGRGGKMQIVDVLSLGQRERLVLVAVGDQQLVLGVAPGRVQAVHTLDTPYVVDTSVSGGSFADVLRKAQSLGDSVSKETKSD
ncbi:MAG: flagellar biosynthetic protein FliO [Granulosicoccaceae bacterium]